MVTNEVDSMKFNKFSEFLSTKHFMIGYFSRNYGYRKRSAVHYKFIEPFKNSRKHVTSMKCYTLFKYFASKNNKDVNDWEDVGGGMAFLIAALVPLLSSN